MIDGMYSKKEVKQYLKAKDYSWEGFIEWMGGQTYSLIEGEDYYNSYDVERYHEGVRMIKEDIERLDKEIEANLKNIRRGLR